MSDFDLSKTTKDQLLKQQQHTKKHLTLDDLKRKDVIVTAIKRVLVFDTSGSMSGYKITEVRRMLTELWQPHLDAVIFNSDVYLLDDRADIAKIHATGSTAMLQALEEVWAHSYKHIILGSDGHPDSGAEPILSAATRHADIPIDTIGIGESGGGGYDPEFLRELARITGGRFTDCGEAIRLTSIVQSLLLNPPKGAMLKDGQDKNGGVIQL